MKERGQPISIRESADFVVAKAAPLTASALAVAAVVANGISQSDYRPLLPDSIREHSGNLGIPLGIVVLGYLIGAEIEIKGRATGNRSLEEFGKALPSYSKVAAVAITIGAENDFIQNSAFLLKENLPDAAFGGIAIALGVIIGKSIKNSRVKY